MSMDKESTYKAEKYRIRSKLLKYTRQAFDVLPPMTGPRILDIGCGSGIPTLELARLCDGEITGIDIDEKALDELRREAERTGVSSRVKTLKCFMTNMEFPDESFDIIWSEGSIFAVGFEKGLREWKRLLKPGGFMVVHDEEGNRREKLKLVKDCGYKLLGQMILDKNTWRQEYFTPLEQLVNKTLADYDDKEKIPEIVESDRREVEWFDTNPRGNSSVYFIMQSVE